MLLALRSLWERKKAIVAAVKEIQQGRRRKPLPLYRRKDEALEIVKVLTEWLERI